MIFISTSLLRHCSCAPSPRTIGHQAPLSLLYSYPSPFSSKSDLPMGSSWLLIRRDTPRCSYSLGGPIDKEIKMNEESQSSFHPDRIKPARNCAAKRRKQWDFLSEWHDSASQVFLISLLAPLISTTPTSSSVSKHIKWNFMISASVFTCLIELKIRGLFISRAVSGAGLWESSTARVFKRDPQDQSRSGVTSSVSNQQLAEFSACFCESTRAICHKKFPFDYWKLACTHLSFGFHRIMDCFVSIVRTSVLCVSLQHSSDD